MKVVAVSDLHLRYVETPEADLLIVAGDMTFRGERAELSWFEGWLSRQPQRYKVWIAGNHELGIEAQPELASDIAARTGSFYLADSAVEIEGLKIWGSPVTPWFGDWAFNRRRGDEIRRHWDLIPESLDILITHGPPRGYLDFVHEDEHLGCEDLLEAVSILHEPPRFMIFGHIHAGYGLEKLRRADGKSIRLINACVCDESYQAVNEPVLFEL